MAKTIATTFTWTGATDGPGFKNRFQGSVAHNFFFGMGVSSLDHVVWEIIDAL